MEDRRFAELDLRSMLEAATDHEFDLLVVVTAYPVD
jgi:hypothetical protein